MYKKNRQALVRLMVRMGRFTKRTLRQEFAKRRRILAIDPHWTIEDYVDRLVECGFLRSNGAGTFTTAE